MSFSNLPDFPNLQSSIFNHQSSTTHDRNNRHVNVSHQGPPQSWLWKAR
jgi:hypothetical protein